MQELESLEMSDKTQEIISIFADAEGARSKYDSKAVEYYKLYRGYRGPLPDDLKGRSNLHIPMTYEHVDTWRSRLLKAFFGPSRPWFDFVAQPREGQIANSNDEKARIAAALNDMQLEKNNVTTLFYDWFTCLLVFPAVIASVGWRHETRKRKRKEQFKINLPGGISIPFPFTHIVNKEETIWDDNEIQLVDFFDFWPDPRGKDVDTCRYAFQREWVTKPELESKLEVLKGAGTGQTYTPDWDALKGIGGGLEEGRFERMSAVGYANTGTEASDAKFPPYELIHYWTDAEHHIIVNRKQTVYAGDNPYWHGQKPFVRGVFEPLPNEFYGMSAVDLIEHLQHELNTNRNQRIDNVSFVLNRMWKVRSGVDIDDSELVSRPHGVIHVDNPDDVTPLEMNDVTGSSYNEEARIRQDAENALAVPSVVRGVDSPAKETATEVATKSSNASIRFDTKIILYEDMGIKRLINLMDQNSQQFFTQPRLVKLFDEDQAMSWQMADPIDILGEWDYRPAGSATDPASNKEVRRQQLMQLAEYAIKTQSPYIKRQEIEKELVRSFDVRNPEKFIKSEEELQQEQMQQAMIQQQQQEQAVQAQQAQAEQEFGKKFAEKALDKALSGTGGGDPSQQVI